jgi:restriction system protein
MPSFIKPKAPNLPTSPTLPPKPVPPPLSEEPQATDKNFQPKRSIFDSVFVARKKDKIQKCKELFEIEHDRWQVECNDIIQETRLRCDKWEAEGMRKIAEFNQSIEEMKRNYEIKLKTAKCAYDTDLDRWVKEKDEYCRNQETQNKSIEKMKSLYLEKLPAAIVEYCEIVLNNSQYPEAFPKDFDLDYNSNSNLLIVEYVLPTPDDLPKLTDVKYIASKNELKESFLSETQLSKIYNSVIYKITLRTLHELFQADKVEALEVIIFNGWVNAIDRATGKKASNCIVTIQAKKIEFKEIELSNVDPKLCFKNLNGIGSSKLTSITAVKPILQITQFSRNPTLKNRTECQETI